MENALETENLSLSINGKKILDDISLQLEKGSVTPFGLLADSERRVTAIFSSYFQDGEIGIHPMVNTSTVFLAFTDLLSLIQEHGNKIVII